MQFKSAPKLMYLGLNITKRHNYYIQNGKALVSICRRHIAIAIIIGSVELLVLSSDLRLRRCEDCGWGIGTEWIFTMENNSLPQ